MKQANCNVRAINADKKRESQVYELMGVCEGAASSPKDLLEELWKQFRPQLASMIHQFPVGYMNGSTKVSWARTPTDVANIWACAKRSDHL